VFADLQGGRIRQREQQHKIPNAIGVSLRQMVAHFMNAMRLEPGTSEVEVSRMQASAVLGWL
jgi:hypothetical protein